MKNKLLLCLAMLFLFLSSCDSDDPAPQIIPKDDGKNNSEDACAIELVEINRITEDDDIEGTEFGDYLISIKSLKTEKEDISIEVLYVKNGVAVETVEVSSDSAVGIDETVILKVTSQNINDEDDFNCIEFFIKITPVGDDLPCTLAATTDC